MAQREYKRTETVNTGAYPNKDEGHANKDVWWESLITIGGSRFSPELKKLIPPALIKAFFLPKCVKKVVM